MRTFDSGATRNVEAGKLDFEGFLSPLALKRFAQYMAKHQVQADGVVRASDNWQRGIPLDSYAKSMFRHFFEFWSAHRGLPIDESIADSLCALMFNVQGYLHELLKKPAAPAMEGIVPHDIAAAYLRDCAEQDDPPPHDGRTPVAYPVDEE